MEERFGCTYGWDKDLDHCYCQGRENMWLFIFVEVSPSMPVLRGWNPGLQSLPARTCMDSVNSAKRSALEMCYVRQFDLNVWSKYFQQLKPTVQVYGHVMWEMEPITSTTWEKQTQTEFSTSSSLISWFQVPVVLGSELSTWIASAFPFNFYMEINQIMANITVAPSLF